MMLTIHGLPLSVKYHDLKSFIKEKCNISDYILDNLVSEGDGTKKVRIGLADEREGSYLVKCLDGVRMFGNILRIVPVGKQPPTNSGPNFDQRGGFPPRNDYNQSGSNFGPGRPLDPMGRPDMVRSEPARQDWGQGNSQWGSNQQGPNQMSQPVQPNNYSYQQQGMNTSYNQQPRPDIRPQYDQRDQYQDRVPQNQGYGMPKNDIPDHATRGRRPDARAHVLRSVEIMEEPLGRAAAPLAPAHPAHPALAPRYAAPPYDHAPKPMTMMKDKFQGAAYDRPAGYGGAPHAAAQPSPWTQPMQSEKEPFAKPGSSTFDRKYPEIEKRVLGKPSVDPGRTLHNPFNKDYGQDKPGPRFSPRRDIPDARGRRMHSPGRGMSPGRRMSPPGRRMSPGRRMPSPGRRMPSPGKRISPGRRLSPGRRPASPPQKRHGSPGRYSPSRRHLEKSGDKYGGERPSLKDVRPAYDPPAQAPIQASYSSGYRPSLHENVQYPIPGARLPEPRASSWQERDKAIFPPGVKKIDDRRMPKFEPRIDPVETKRSRSPRKSRSPIRRDRSPARDRFKKHSPSPRSPRRSWALEKRRSPEAREAPPPPVWPGQAREEEQFRRFSERPDDDKKRVPIWEPRRPEDERRFENPVRVRTDLGTRSHREPSPRGGYKPQDQFPPRDPKFVARDTKFDSRDPKFDSRDPKFEPRDPKFESRDPKFEPRDAKYDPREPKFEPREEFRRVEDAPKRFERDFREPQRSNDDIRSGTRHDNRREEFTRESFLHREEERKIPKVPETFNKEFEDVYQRALELNKRAEELRRRDDRRRDDFERRDSRERDPKDYDRKFDRRNDRPDDRTNDGRHEPEWKVDSRKNTGSSSYLMTKRQKAIDEITNKIIDKQGAQFSGDIRSRVFEELRIVVGKIMLEMFGYIDVSFIEMVIKFNAKYDQKAEARMFNDVLASLPSNIRSMKRPANEPIRPSEVPAKFSRHTHEADLNRDNSHASKDTYIPEWKPNTLSSGMMANLPPPTVHIPNPILVPQFDMAQQMGMMAQPLMVPAPNYGSYENEINSRMQDDNFQALQSKKFSQQAPADDGNNLYLCKDDFEPYSSNQAEYLKKFLVSQLINASQHGQGWSPDFTLKGLQSVFRYEVETRDDATRDWLMNLDFNEFQLFNVLVYTKEELWYERAAVWLPGHSRCRNIEPLTKLKLQNRLLEGVNIGKWKFVKKVITAKGTRIYVDMPPSSARALEKHKMLLSYELQKVSVFLKAVAVDKEVFDSGLRAPSVTNPADIVAAAQNSPMPSLGHDPNIVKICLKGNKALSVEQARKTKDMIIYHIFKYHQDNTNTSLRTDFVKFGYCLPGYFGLLPENPESKRWLTSLNIGKLNRHAVVVLGADDATTKYIKMSVYLKREPSRNTALVFERLKQSNQGVKGLNFSLWKPLSVHSRDRHHCHKIVFEVEMDLESVETLKNKLQFKLDYVDDRHNQDTVTVRYENPGTRLEDHIKKLKSEMDDSYDVANMDIASSDDDDDIIYMGEVK